jgi:hypothetical protein
MLSLTSPRHTSTLRVATADVQVGGQAVGDLHNLRGRAPPKTEVQALPGSTATTQSRRRPKTRTTPSGEAAIILLSEIEQPVHGRSGPRGVARPHAFQHRLVHRKRLRLIFHQACRQKK